MALIGLGIANIVPLYTCGYSDQPGDLDGGGHVPVPAGLGLGVTYDWEVIRKNAIVSRKFES